MDKPHSRRGLVVKVNVARQGGCVNLLSLVQKGVALKASPATAFQQYHPSDLCQPERQ